MLQCSYDHAHPECNRGRKRNREEEGEEEEEEEEEEGEEEEGVKGELWLTNVRIILKSFISAQRALNAILVPEMDSPSPYNVIKLISRKLEGKCIFFSCDWKAQLCKILLMFCDFK